MIARPRGYLMWEVLLGGAMIAILLGTTVGILADARRNQSIAANEATASAVAHAKADELVSGPVLAPSSLPVVTTWSPVDLASYPSLAWRWAVDEARAGNGGVVITQASNPTLDVDAVQRVVVQVRYPGVSGTRIVTVQRFLRKRT